MSTPVASLPATTGRRAKTPVWPAIATLAGRELLRFVRQRSRVFGAVAQPALFWALFGAGLGPSFRLPGVAANVAYAEYFFPGVVVLVLLFTAIFTTISIIEDRREGFLQGVLVAPIPRWTMVFGKLAGGALLATGEGLAMLCLAPLAGFSPSLFAVLGAVLLLAVLALALTALGFAIAWQMESTQGFHAVMNLFLMPLWLLSGAFFPAASGPLAWIVRLNPLTYGVGGLRRLLYDGATDRIGADVPALATCWIVSLGLAAGLFVLAWLVAGRRTSGDLV
ncbi:MAG: ABC transporter permease [Pirellulales bacterium]|nr:ABC transporter permease [Pirellulales bacterium]